MVSAILLHYVIDDLLPTRGTFGDPGSNPGADNFFFFFFKKQPYIPSRKAVHVVRACGKKN